MKIYLASRWGRKEEMKEVAAKIKLMGHEITSEWIDEGSMDQEYNYGGENWNPSEVMANYTARRDFYGINKCSLLVIFTDYSPDGTTGGRHVEFGAAYVMGKLTIVVGPQTNPFLYLSDHHFDTEEDFYKWLGSFHGQDMETS